MHKWESVKVIQYYCCSLDFTRFYASCINCQFVRIALKQCFYRTDVDCLFYEYNVNFGLSLSVTNEAVYRKFANICRM